LRSLTQNRVGKLNCSAKASRTGASGPNQAPR